MPECSSRFGCGIRANPCTPSAQSFLLSLIDLRPYPLNSRSIACRVEARRGHVASLRASRQCWREPELETDFWHVPTGRLDHRLMAMRCGLTTPECLSLIRGTDRATSKHRVRRVALWSFQARVIGRSSQASRDKSSFAPRGTLDYVVENIRTATSSWEHEHKRHEIQGIIVAVMPSLQSVKRRHVASGTHNWSTHRNGKYFKYLL